jgi:GTP-binding protein Era
VIPISAANGDGVDSLVDEVVGRLPLGPRMFPEDMYTDRAERFLAAELVREQLYLQLGDELPYSSAVVVEDFEERTERGDVVIHANVYVERRSQKGIVVGAGGARIKQVGERARVEIARLLGCDVHLMLHVKVSPDWTQAKSGLRKMADPTSANRRCSTASSAARPRSSTTAPASRATAATARWSTSAPCSTWSIPAASTPTPSPR